MAFQKDISAAKKKWLRKWATHFKKKCKTMLSLAQGNVFVITNRCQKEPVLPLFPWMPG
jgi:hypothetical protein